MFLTAKQRAKGSLNPEFAAQCGDKFRHYNFLVAMQHANSLEKDDKKAGRGKHVVIYHCDFCGAEHIGHLDRPKFQFPNSDESAKIERDRHVTTILKSGTAVARQGKPTMLCPSKSISIENGRKAI